MGHSSSTMIVKVLSLFSSITLVKNSIITPQPDCLKDLPVRETFWDNTEQKCVKCNNCDDEDVELEIPCSMFSDAVCQNVLLEDSILQNSFESWTVGKVIYESATEKNFDLPVIYGRRKYLDDSGKLRLRQDFSYGYVAAEPTNHEENMDNYESEKIKMIKNMIQDNDIAWELDKSEEGDEVDERSKATKNKLHNNTSTITVQSQSFPSNVTINTSLNDEETLKNQHQTSIIYLILAITSIFVGILIILTLIYYSCGQKCFHIRSRRYQGTTTITSYSNCSSLDCEMV